MSIRFRVDLEERVPVHATRVQPEWRGDEDRVGAAQPGDVQVNEVDQLLEETLDDVVLGAQVGHIQPQRLHGQGAPGPFVDGRYEGVELRYAPRPGDAPVEHVLGLELERCACVEDGEHVGCDVLV